MITASDSEQEKSDAIPTLEPRAKREVVLEYPVRFPGETPRQHLLAGMENEDQLATVLGHEMTHVEYRHMLRHQRSAKNKQIGFSVGAVAAAVILAGEAGEAYDDGKYGKAARLDVLGHLMIGLGLQLAFIAAVNGYGRDLEREADEGGFAKMAAAGHDIDEAPAICQALLDDQGESGKMEVFFFGSHPKLASRIESANE